MHQYRGFTLMEMIVFFTVLGILLSGFFAAYHEIMVNTDQPGRVAIAAERAAGRLELILSTKRNLGYAGYYDPCNAGSSAVVCANTTRTTTAIASGDQIVVVGQDDDNTVAVTLTTVVGNY